MQHPQLVITRKNLLALFLAGLCVFLFDNLGIVFENVGEARRGEQGFPQVIGLHAVWIGRVARAIVPARHRCDDQVF